MGSNYSDAKHSQEKPDKIEFEQIESLLHALGWHWQWHKRPDEITIRHGRYIMI